MQIFPEHHKTFAYKFHRRWPNDFQPYFMSNRDLRVLVGSERDI